MRCAGNTAHSSVADDTPVVIEGFELRIEDGADYALLLHVLESCARETVRMRSFQLARVTDGAASAPQRIRLPFEATDAAVADALRVTLHASGEHGRERRVEVVLSGTDPGETFHTNALTALADDLARRRAHAVRHGTAVIDATPGVRYGDVAPVLAALSEAGYTDLRFAQR